MIRTIRFDVEGGLFTKSRKREKAFLNRLHFSLSVNAGSLSTEYSLAEERGERIHTVQIFLSPLTSQCNHSAETQTTRGYEHLPSDLRMAVFGVTPDS